MSIYLETEVAVIINKTMKTTNRHKSLKHIYLLRVNDQGKVKQSQHDTFREFSAGSSDCQLRQSATPQLWSSSPETHSFGNQETQIIKKSSGEPSHPNAGGHNVERKLIKLHWSKALYVRLDLHSYGFIPLIDCLLECSQVRGNQKA